jgi:hydroxyethylthiazole kinase-like uncharacterized protein yjeF
MIELLTPAEMAEADRLAIAAGISGSTLMENAGHAVADAVAARHASGASVAVVAGPGNNGGDGFVAARVLADRGYRVRVLLYGTRDRLKGDAAQAAQRWSGPVEAATPDGLANTEVIVDALFGAGLDRAVEGAGRVLIDAMNAAPARVYAVDLPSGIHGATGAVMGAAVTAAETVTFFRRKPGHLLLPGRLHCGAVHVGEIGIPATVLATIKPTTFANAPPLWGALFPAPRIDAHKYTRGHAVVGSGGLTSTGAGRLAARGALRAGAGLVTLVSPREALAINAAANLAIMVRAVDGADEFREFLADPRRNAVVLGPGAGVGGATRELVLTAMAGARSVVLDADALTSFAGDPETLIAAIRGRLPAATVFTPHDGEFARLFENLIEGPRTRFEKAILAAEKSGAFVVLKGPDTIVAAPDGRAAIADNAPLWLATAGSGDVLAGMIGGLLAQGMPGFEGAAAAVWLHGEAGNEAGPGLIAEDLPETLPRVYRRLFPRLGLDPL